MSGCEATYERARARLERDGSMSEHWLVTPEPAAPGSGGDWDGVLAEENQGLAPKASDLLALVLEHGGEPEDPVVLALDALLEDPAYRPWDGGALVATLARGRTSVRRGTEMPRG